MQIITKEYSYGCGVWEPCISEDHRILKIGVDTFLYQLTSSQPEPWKDTTEPKVRQLPASLAGTWKMDSFREQYNDSVYNRV